MSRPTVALTGATGFLGHHLLASLAGAGWRVCALSRSGRIEGGGEAEVVAGHLGDEAALGDLVDGVDAVVHAAGLVKAKRAAEFSAVNGRGTARLLHRAGEDAPDAHVLLVSSLAAREPQLSAYAASKREAEDEARRLVAPHRLTIVRLPTIYGPHDREALSVFQSARLPLTPLLSDGRERIAMLHVADAADAIVRLLDSRTAGLFAFADDRPEGYRMREIFVEAGRAQGCRPRMVPIPRPLFVAAGHATVAFGRLAGKATILSPGKVREMLHPDWSVDPADMPPGMRGRARSLADGFQETVTWYRTAGWL